MTNILVWLASFFFETMTGSVDEALQCWETIQALLKKPEQWWKRPLYFWVEKRIASTIADYETLREGGVTYVGDFRGDEDDYDMTITMLDGIEEVQQDT